MPPRYQRRVLPRHSHPSLAQPHPLARFFMGRYTGGAGAGHSTTRLMGVLTPVQTPSEAGGTSDGDTDRHHQSRSRPDPLGGSGRRPIMVSLMHRRMPVISTEQGP